MNADENTSPALADVLRVAASAWRLMRAGSALDRALAVAMARWTGAQSPRLGAAAKDVAYTATRRLALIEAMTARLARQAPAPEVASVLAVALGQLLGARHAQYAVVDQAVRAAKADPATRAASGFINAVLRSALRQGEALVGELSCNETVRYNAPAWWIERLRQAYPQHWADILEAQAPPPPLVLRVNRRRISVERWLQQALAEGVAATRVGTDAVSLGEPRPVERIPGFATGIVSVQDAGAQLAVELLGVGDGMRVLDACAAPGGKTGQLAEVARVEVDAVEVDAARAVRIEDNLARLHAREYAHIDVVVADAAEPQRWARARSYERVLLDAPCTASGIVRRHPDIPWLRRVDDVAQLATRQQRLLDALWPLLVPAGRLLYVVCSLFPEEGARRAEEFLRRHRDALGVELPGPGGVGLQLLPTADPAERWIDGLPTQHDGFFFALFEKRAG